MPSGPRGRTRHEVDELKTLLAGVCACDLRTQIKHSPLSKEGPQPVVALSAGLAVGRWHPCRLGPSQPATWCAGCKNPKPRTGTPRSSNWLAFRTNSTGKGRRSGLAAWLGRMTSGLGGSSSRPSEAAAAHKARRAVATWKLCRQAQCRQGMQCKAQVQGGSLHCSGKGRLGCKGATQEGLLAEHRTLSAGGAGRSADGRSVHKFQPSKRGRPQQQPGSAGRSRLQGTGCTQGRVRRSFFTITIMRTLEQEPSIQTHSLFLRSSK